MLPLKHIHKKKLQRLPKKYDYSLLDRLMYLIAFAGPIMTIPQIYDIWITKNSTVNEITWGSYLAGGIIWLIYGIVHKEKPIIFSNILGIIATGLVFVGAMMSR